MSSKPHRVQLSRKKGWRMPENTVKVDRSTKWGNPFNLKSPDHCWTALAFGEKGNPAGRQAASVTLFRMWLASGGVAKVAGCGLYATDADGRTAVFAESPGLEASKPPQIELIQSELRGKNLACWCKLDAPCHADALLEIANREPGHE